MLIMDDAYFNKVLLIYDEFRIWAPTIAPEPRKLLQMNNSNLVVNSTAALNGDSVMNAHRIQQHLSQNQMGNQSDSTVIPMKKDFKEKGSIDKRYPTASSCKQHCKASDSGSITEGHGKSCFSKDSSYNARLEHPIYSKKFCNFCRQNGERRGFYQSHQLRDRFGYITCPILWAHHCEICGATGNDAHTKSYCPFLKAAGKKPFSAVMLKHTPRNSSGSLRKNYF